MAEGCDLLIVRVDHADQDEAEIHWEFLSVEDRAEAIDRLAESRAVEYLATDARDYNEIKAIQRMWHNRQIKRDLRVRIYCSNTDTWKSWRLVSHKSIRHLPSVRADGVIDTGIYADNEGYADDEGEEP